MVSAILPEDVEPGLARLSEGLAHDVDRHAGDLDVHLERGDALVGARDLEVHVAVVVFAAHDVGEDADLLAFLDEAHGDARHRRLERHPRVHEAMEAPHTVAIDDEPLDSRISDTTRMVYGKTSLAGSTRKWRDGRGRRGRPRAVPPCRSA
jgi:hypothetical protein